MSIVKTHSRTLRSADSIILINTPRYVMWAPLFDSTWDFQSMVRIVLDDKQARAGVVSERMKVSREDVKDVFGRQVCGHYPFKGMVLLKPCPERLIQVGSAEQFIGEVESEGLKFGLDPKTIDKWRLELAQSP